MNWEDKLRQLIHLPNGYPGPLWIDTYHIDVLQRTSGEVREIIIDKLSNIIRGAIDEALFVLPHKETPIRDRDIELIRGELTRQGSGSGIAVVRRMLADLLKVIEWQKARIAHMANDNGFQDGVEAGRKHWDDENRKWIEEIQ